MKNLKNLLIYLMPALFLTACFDFDENGLFNCEVGDGPFVSQELFISDFHSIKVCDPINVEITQGEEFIVVAEGPEDVIELLELDIQSRTWDIEFEDCIRWNRTDEVYIYITMPEVRSLEINGSGDIYSQNVLIADDLELRIDGSGDMDIATEADRIEARITGSGSMFLEGIADKTEIRITGSGDVKAFDLESRKAEVKVNGSGDTEVTVTKELSVRINGSGDVYFRGNPDLDIEVNGSGDVIDLN